MAKRIPTTSTTATTSTDNYGKSLPSRPDYSGLTLKCAQFRAFKSELATFEVSAILADIRRMADEKREAPRAARAAAAAARANARAKALGLDNAPAHALGLALLKAYPRQTRAGKLTGTAWLNSHVAAYVGKPTKTLLDDCHKATGRAEVRNHLANVKRLAKSIGLTFAAPDGGTITLTPARAAK